MSRIADVYGEDFKKLYEHYEAEGKGRKTIKARQLWFSILDSQMETGTPYILYKDACNEKSNQKNLGTIKSSNLCTEIIEYSDSNETAVCNLHQLLFLAMFATTKHLIMISCMKLPKLLPKILIRLLTLTFILQAKHVRVICYTDRLV